MNDGDPLGSSLYAPAMIAERRLGWQLARRAPLGDLRHRAPDRHPHALVLVARMGPQRELVPHEPRRPERAEGVDGMCEGVILEGGADEQRLVLLHKLDP